MFDFFISGTQKQGAGYYLVTISDTTELLGSCQYIIEAKNTGDAQVKAMDKHTNEKAKK